MPCGVGAPLKFLSTLSLRRATVFVCVICQRLAISIHALLAESDGFYAGLLLANADFYPRSPCGERPAEGERVSYTYAISIHALLAESDLGSKARQAMQAISIHALLAESDSMGLDGRFKL